jgi:hypothetical protein
MEALIYAMQYDYHVLLLHVQLSILSVIDSLVIDSLWI